MYKQILKNLFSKNLLPSKNVLPSKKQSYSLLYRTTRRHTFNDISLKELQKLRYNDDYNNHNHNHNNKNNNNKFNIVFPIVGVTMGTMVIGGVLFKSYYQNMLDQEYNLEDEHTVMNYSATHSATPLQFGSYIHFTFFVVRDRLWSFKCLKFMNYTVISHQTQYQK